MAMHIIVGQMLELTVTAKSLAMVVDLQGILRYLAQGRLRCQPNKRTAISGRFSLHGRYGLYRTGTDGYTKLKDPSYPHKHIMSKTIEIRIVVVRAS